MPCYNVSEYLSDSLDTVIGQTYENLQIVLIDDGSKDDTLKIAEEYASRDNRIEVYTQKNQGVASTRNNLLDKVKGEFVLFVDSDDWIELDMVEHLVGLAVEHNVGMVMCDRVINDTQPIETTPIIRNLSQEDSIKDFLYHEYFIGSLCNKVIKSSLLRDKCFNKEISYGEDALFVWDVLQGVDRVVATTKQLYHYRMNEESISHQTFGEKKLTGHKTWQIITDEVRQFWSQYLDIALGTFALQDMYLLRAASQSGYKKDKMIRQLQSVVLVHLSKILNRNNVTLKECIYAQIISRCYAFGRFYYFLHKCKKR